MILVVGRAVARTLIGGCILGGGVYIYWLEHLGVYIYTGCIKQNATLNILKYSLCFQAQ